MPPYTTGGVEEVSVTERGDTNQDRRPTEVGRLSLVVLDLPGGDTPAGTGRLSILRMVVNRTKGGAWTAKRWALPGALQFWTVIDDSPRLRSARHPALKNYGDRCWSSTRRTAS
jgi:hypothetical protein